MQKSTGQTRCEKGAKREQIGPFCHLRKMNCAGDLVIVAKSVESRGNLTGQEITTSGAGGESSFHGIVSRENGMDEEALRANRIPLGRHKPVAQW